MKHYWDIIGGTSDSLIYRSRTFKELLSLGYYYTVSEACRDARCSMTRSLVAEHFVSRYSVPHYEAVLESARAEGSTLYPYEILNERGMYSPRGVEWTYGTGRRLFGVDRGKKVPSNYDWYLEVNSMWRTIVEESRCTNLHAVSKEMVSRGFLTKNGKLFTRQCLTYIVERVPEMDWSLVSIEDIKDEKRSELASLLEGVDLGSFSSKKDVYEYLGIDLHSDQVVMSEVLLENGWRNNTDDWHAYWDGVFASIRGVMVSDGWVGWNRLAEDFVREGQKMYNGDDWIAWRLSRLCRKYGFDKDAEYEKVLKSYVSSWLSSYEGGDVLSALCSDLNGRGYVMPNWYELREASRTFERYWTEELLQRAISDGLL